MSGSSSGGDLLGHLAEDFLERYRRGEQPALTEYTARHPGLAEQIRELFPALVMLEDVRPGPPTLTASGDTGSPRRLGEYRLVREIGRGGMGVVYEAEQESLGRRVALKVLPPGALGDRRHVERFQREARAAARLHHTNIVPVFGVGEEGGTHYYVMQYIEGRPLNEVLDELRRLRDEAAQPAAAPTAAGSTSGGELPDESASLPTARVARSLQQGQFRPASQPEGRVANPGASAQADPATNPPVPAAPDPNLAGSGAAHSSSLLSRPQSPFAKSVAQIGIQVAEALEYAAGQGVLHRDVKPSNLLLDVWGTVWLTDFGLAKATGTPDLTRPGDLLGTLRYLAPERFEGRADVRSDVYALGLTLYEMLALRPAFRGHGEGELARQITAAEAPRLDRVDPRVPRDLVTIVHKAMAREPADRYQTPRALAEDLRRFLDDRSILARRASLPEQAWRWCRRNPTGAALVAAVLALVLLAIGGGLWRERQQAERLAERARRRDLARQAVEAALQQADPRRARDRWREAKAVLASVENRLDEAGCQDLRQRLKQASADLELATALEQIRVKRAAFIEGAFATETAAQDYATAFAEAGLAGAVEVTAEQIRQSAIREQLVAALDDWALAATDLALQARLARLACLADPDPRWRDRIRDPIVWGKRAALEKLAAEAPLAELSPALLTLLATRLRKVGADVEPLLRTAQRLQPADFWLNFELGMALRDSKPAEAAGFFRAALVARPDCSQVYNMLGLVLAKVGGADEAIAAYRRAVELDGKNSAAHYNLADALSDRGQMAEALAEYRRASQLNPPVGVPAHNKLGVLLADRGQVRAAMAHYRQAIARNPTASPPHHNLGLALAEQGQIEEAMAEYRRAIALDPRAPGPHLELARCLEGKGQLDQAMVEYGRAIELEPRMSAAHYHLGLALQTRGRTEEALAHFRKATQFDPGGAQGHEALADALLRLGRFAEARAAGQRGLSLVPGNDPRRQPLRQKLDECERMLALDARLPVILQGKVQPTDAAEQLKLARLCRDHGRPYAAARLYALAFTTRPALADDLASRNRYDAACAAARALGDLGSEEARPGESERTSLRRQALDWLRADLALGTRLQRDGKSAGWSPTTWQTDAALASVRDPANLEKLPVEERQQWQRLWAEVTALRADDPREQGRAHAARREWGPAADSYLRAFKFGQTDEGHFWFEYAALMLLSGDRQGYARACMRMVERCGQEVPDLRAYHVARACTLAPDSVADAAQSGRLAQKELTDKAREFWSQTERAALHYRAGRFQEALPLLEQSLRVEGLPGRAVLNWLWLALAHQRLGKMDEARRWLSKAQAWLDQFGDGMPNRAEEELGLHFHNWLEAHVLRREAEALLGAGPPGPKEPEPAVPPKK
jgi:serine/threonine protein kinase/Flp pilus assembly protein TadD